MINNDGILIGFDHLNTGNFTLKTIFDSGTVSSTDGKYNRELFYQAVTEIAASRTTSIPLMAEAGTDPSILQNYWVTELSINPNETELNKTIGFSIC